MNKLDLEKESKFFFLVMCAKIQNFGLEVWRTRCLPSVQNRNTCLNKWAVFLNFLNENNHFLESIGYLQISQLAILKKDDGFVFSGDGVRIYADYFNEFWYKGHWYCVLNTIGHRMVDEIRYDHVLSGNARIAAECYASSGPLNFMAHHCIILPNSQLADLIQADRINRTGAF